MRDALSLTDQAIAFGSGQLQEASVRLMLGSVDRSHVFRLIEALALATAAPWWRRLTPCASTACRPPARWRKWLPCCSAWPCCRRCRRWQPPWTPATPRRRARLAAALPADETQLLYSICLAWPYRAGPGTRRVRRPDHGAAAPAGFKPAECGLAPRRKKTLTRPEPAAPAPVAVAADPPVAPARRAAAHPCGA